jgi:hypothetical protein
VAELTNKSTARLHVIERIMMMIPGEQPSR